MVRGRLSYSCGACAPWRLFHQRAQEPALSEPEQEPTRGPGPEQEQRGALRPRGGPNMRVRNGRTSPVTIEQTCRVYWGRLGREPWSVFHPAPTRSRRQLPSVRVGIFFVLALCAR